MPSLSGTVGDSSDNKPHDVALVELLLRLATNPKTKRPFFGNDFDAKFTKKTKDAIIAFQVEFNLSPPPPAPVKPAPHSSSGSHHASGKNTATPPAPPPTTTAPATAATVGTDKTGIVAPGSATFNKLVATAAAVNADYKLLRAIPGTAMIFLEMTQSEFDEKLKAVTDSELQVDFKAKVVALIRKMYAEHKIALSGWGKLSYRRSFANQHEVLSRGTSQAGPGESNHQFGQALDVGYVGLRYIRRNGEIAKILNEDNFDKALLGSQRAALIKARNDIWEKAPQGSGTLFRIRLNGGDNDPNHFQNFNQFSKLYPDTTVDIHKSLVSFLSTISGFVWEKGHGGHYKCDLGTGSTPADVGTADQIWTGTASLTKAEYLKMLNESLKKQGKPTHKDISAADFKSAFDRLKGVFEDAERRWSEWVPLDASGSPI